jgi:hypothetical protein
MKIPKLHSDRLNEFVSEISALDDSVVKTFKRLNDAVNARAKKACEKIDGFISDIKEILATNECGKMDLKFGYKKFILHNSIKDVYIATIGEDDEVKSAWPPKDNTKLNEAKNLKPIACKNDALENLAKIEYLEEQARCGEAMLKDLLLSYKEHVSYQLEKLETFIEKADLNLEDQK